MDIVVPTYSLGKDVVLDVAVTCLLQHKHLFNAAQITDFACNDDTEQVIFRNYQERVQRERFIYSTSLLFLNHFKSYDAISLSFSSNSPKA